ncbi:hypothetical protein [Rhodoferax sp.]|nr:hypothetical protein [Rhodoferax sp.]
MTRFSSTWVVAATRNRYFVPGQWAGHIVSTRVYREHVDAADAA